MNISSKPLNKQALTLEEAETLLRILVKEEYLKGTLKSKIDIKAKQIIDEALKYVTIPTLKDVSYKSLVDFYQRQYREMSKINAKYLNVLFAIMKLTDKSNKVVKMPIYQAKTIVREAIKEHNTAYGTTYDSTKVIGQAFREFSKDYMEKRIEPVFNRLISQQPIVTPAGTPTAIINSQIHQINTLRNRAEKEVRYHGHQSSIANFRQKGVKLVIASVHSNCSARCRRWQGKVYSLDHTTGTTTDGRPYVPLEVATDVPYVTKAGVVYMNGLLGFNCRHYLVEYKDGFKFPKPNPIEEAKEYKIDLEQRYLERKVREWRTKAIYYKSTMPSKYNQARLKAQQWNARYIQFSRANNRAYYPSRTKLI